jgi:hypothetical protein
MNTSCGDDGMHGHLYTRKTHWSLCLTYMYIHTYTQKTKDDIPGEDFNYVKHVIEASLGKPIYEVSSRPPFVYTRV